MKDDLQVAHLVRQMRKRGIASQEIVADLLFAAAGLSQQAGCGWPEYSAICRMAWDRFVALRAATTKLGGKS